MLQGFTRRPSHATGLHRDPLMVRLMRYTFGLSGPDRFLSCEGGMKLEKKKKNCGTVRPGYSRRFQDLKFAPQHGHNVAQLLSLADPLSTSSTNYLGFSPTT
ncbi:hypothetical protein V3481_004762 [Fusarium oxysporum f. sp. vasinfectum]|jgi:hypothetical protein